MSTSQALGAADDSRAAAASAIQMDGRTVPIRIRRFDPDVPLPRYALAGDAGADLVTTIDIVLPPGQRALLPTGIAVALPDGYAGFVHPRSGLAARAGLGLVNAPGTIDAGYRGEIKVIVINHDRLRSIELRRGDRIAQLVIQRVEHAEFVEVATLESSERGAGGHGSTGGSHILTAAGTRESPESERGDDR